MKRTILVALVAILILVLASASAAQVTGSFNYVDFEQGNPHPEVVTPDTWYTSFNYVGLQCFGGNAAVAFLPSAEHPVPSGIPGRGEVNFDWTTGETPRRLELVVFDSGQHDSFYVQYSHPKKAGQWTTMYSYTAVGDGAWHTHTITKFPFGIGKGHNKTLTMRIVPSNPGYDAICGHIAVDYVALFTSKN